MVVLLAGERPLRRAREGRGVVVRLGVPKVKEPHVRRRVAPGDEALRAVDEEGAAGLVGLETVPVDGVLGRGGADIKESDQGLAA